MKRMGFVMVPGVFGLLACSSSNESESIPPGACKTNGTATGSFVAACNDCGRRQCNAELSDKAGSRWVDNIWGGDGACKAFNECTCACLASKSDPISCATTACIAEMDPACRAALQAAQDCLNAKCAAECR